MKLEKPNKKHKESYEKLIKEWSKFEDIDKTSPGALFYGNNFEDFLEEVKIYEKEAPNGFVNSSLFLLVDNYNIIGAIDIRHSIESPVLSEIGGHIGYGIAPKYRKQGFATKMLELGLLEVKKLGINKVLITCDIDNIGSNKVIQSNGGIFERKSNDGNMNRYFIKI